MDNLNEEFSHEEFNNMVSESIEENMPILEALAQQDHNTKFKCPKCGNGSFIFYRIGDGFGVFKCIRCLYEFTGKLVGEDK